VSLTRAFIDLDRELSSYIIVDATDYVCTFNVVEGQLRPRQTPVTLRERGIDFATDAEKVFAGRKATFVSDRSDYGDVRLLTVGWLNERMVLMVWTERGEDRHIISMRYCHAKEAEKLIRRFDQT
jgi:uncharacterized DUF497 family protein